MNMTRRRLCSLLGLGALSYGYAERGRSAVQERAISIEAKRFSYTPNQIFAKTGEPVVLEFTAVDFMHGFKIPDMNIRADLVPGKITKVRLQFDKAGDYDFLCDNFCGSGHENMNGKIIVRT
ncbi:cupredoxin domain-containing protein [Paraherbaspirillum soli]|uniref:Cupredoxin domain-containing protein n=1 Tax=Paraherbaspirillum soli TaxID=631222 RepID=A0ABW0M3G1_9BURK